jgi:DNA-binding CsgD family transcriptional regulator
MYSIAAILLALLVIDRVTRNKTWFNMLCFAIEGIYMVIIFSLLVSEDFPVELFGIMRAGIVILQVWLLILLSETFIKQSVSPIFVYGILAVVYLLPNVIGDIAASFLLSVSANTVPILVGGALMTIAVAAGVIVILFIKNKDPDVRIRSEEQAAAQDRKNMIPHDEALSQKDEHFVSFCTQYGLSKMESEVISLYSQGRSVRTISAKLFISESTTRTYIQRVYAKLNIHNRQKLLDILDEVKETTQTPE